MKASLARNLKNFLSEIKEKIKISCQTSFDLSLKTERVESLRISWKVVIILNALGIVLILIVKLLIG